MEALADCIIPPDPQTPGGKDSGSALFIDRQLAGPYGRQDGLYVRPPFMKGTKSQGHQSEKGPAQEYREGLAALDRGCKAKFDGKAFADLSDQDKDAVLNGLESAEFKLDGAVIFVVVLRHPFIAVSCGVRQNSCHAMWSGHRDLQPWR